MSLVPPSRRNEDEAAGAKIREGILKKLILSRDIVAKYNIPYSTITHYTNMGFFNVVSRKGNKRVYNEDEVRSKMEKLTQLINEGYPLRLIRKKFEEEK